jgi:hypothetical protein
VDTNVIIEAHRTRTWRALAGGCRVETVEDCVTETQTGFQMRRPEQLIAISELRASLAAVHGVSNRQRAELAVRALGVALDRGEESLWAHALGRADDWFLCGPDRASLRCGVILGFRDRMVALETLLDNVGCRLRIPLKRHYTRKWLEAVLGQIIIAEK